MLRLFLSATFMFCVRNFPRREVLVKVGVMEFGLYQAYESLILVSSKHSYLQPLFSDQCKCHFLSSRLAFVFVLFFLYFS